MQDLSYEETWKYADLRDLSLNSFKNCLEKGWNINAQSLNSNQSILFRAVLHRQPKWVKTFVNYGANVNLQDNEKATPLHYAVSAFLFCLKKKQHILSQLFPNIFRKDLVILKTLLDANADVNIQDEKGATPMHVALDSQNYDAVRLLLKKPVNLNLVDFYGRSCLHKLAEHPDIKLMKLFVKHGADISLKDNQGKTAFDVLHEERCDDIIPRNEYKNCEIFLIEQQKKLSLQKIEEIVVNNAEPLKKEELKEQEAASSLHTVVKHSSTIEEKVKQEIKQRE